MTAKPVVLRFVGDTKDLEQSFRTIQKRAEDTESSFSKFGQKASDVGKKMTAFATIPVAAAFGGMIKAASDLNESVSKTNTVFGDSAKAIHSFSDSAAKNLGISRQQAEEAAGAFGNLFVTMGLAKPKAAEMSTGLVQLAADLASFNNLDPAEALEKLRSGLVGEIEPLRALGVSFNEAQVKAKGMELGLADAHGELSEGAKVQVRYALIMEQTKTAQGDFARTADGVANKTRIMKAQMADAAATMGTSLLPIATKLIGVATSMAQGFAKMPKPLQDAALMAAALVAAVGPLTLIAGNAAKAVQAAGKAVTFFATSSNVAALSASALGLSLAGIVAGAIAYNQVVAAMKQANQGLIDSQTTVINVMALGGKATRENVVDAYTEAFRYTQGAAGATDQYAEAFKKFGAEAKRVLTETSTSTGVTKERIVELANSLGINLGNMSEEAREKLAGAIAQISGATTPTEVLAAATDTLNNSFATAKERLDAYSAALDAVLGGFLDAQTSAVAYSRQLDRLSDAYNEANGKAHLAGEKHRALVEALNDTVRAAQRDIEAMARAGTVTNDAAVKKQLLLERLADLKKRWPELIPFINEYINRLSSIPANIQTDLIVRQIGTSGDFISTGEGPKVKVRAAGGPVTANEPYMIGEKGPELFVPRTSGSIVPNHRLQSGGPLVHIETAIVRDVDELAEATGREMLRASYLLGAA